MMQRFAPGFVKGFHFALWLLAVLAVTAQDLPAVQPEEVLEDPVLEARARDISLNLRCLVCQNQSIDDSNAELAKDLRVLVRERLVAGDSDQQVIDYVVDRYGDFVLLKPPVKPVTYLLWAAPVLVLLFGGSIVILAARRRRRAAAAEPEPLSADEKTKLAEYLGKEER
jgi:cytochrome c-type biogenesis protein CcmH